MHRRLRKDRYTYPSQPVRYSTMNQRSLQAAFWGPSLVGLPLCQTKLAHGFHVSTRSELQGLADVGSKQNGKLIWGNLRSTSNSLIANNCFVGVVELVIPSCCTRQRSQCDRVPSGRYWKHRKLKTARTSTIHEGQCHDHPRIGMLERVYIYKYTYTQIHKQNHTTEHRCCGFAALN